MLGTVYRPVARDEHGDPVGAEGEILRLAGDDTIAKLGTIAVIIGGTSGSTRLIENLSGFRGDRVATEGMLGFRADSDIALQDGDLVQIDGAGRFAIHGPVVWGRPHSLTGSPPRWRWIAYQAS